MDIDDDSTGQTPSAANQPSTGSTPQAGSGSASVTSGAPSSGPPSNPASGSARDLGSSNQHSKRRRGLGVVTPNACTECRKKRAKCDGQKPCGRCRGQKDIECVYEVPVRQSKENLRTEIDTLRQQKRNSDQIFAALGRTELWEEVLSRLRSGQSTDSISDWLGGSQSSSSGGMPSFPQQNDGTMGSGPNMTAISSFGAVGSGNMAAMGLGVQNMSPATAEGQQQPRMQGEMGQGRPWELSHSHGASGRGASHPDAMNWTANTGMSGSGPPQSQVGSWPAETQDHMSGSMPRFRGLEQILSPLNEPEMRSTSGSWTSITGDINLVQHLLALYFCWEYPTFASLSKEHFLRDFQDGRHRYCSPILVNALLALGCRFSTQPMTRADPDDPYTSGDHFFKESQRLFYHETDHHSLTTIQALGIMSIREASCGRDSESWYYAGQSIRLAIEMGLHRIHDEGDEDELAVQSATFWGAFALDHAWSLATGSLPQCSCFPHLPPKPAIINDIEASLWVPYTDNGAPLQRSCEQPSNVRSVYKCFCELSELVHQSLYILHSPGRPLTARDLLNLYTQYLNWYDRIPEVLRLGHNFTPAVLFAHMYYHFAILLLFRPLIKLRIIGSNVTPKDVCSQAADAIQGLLKSYSQLYTLRRTPSFVPYFVLTSAIMHLAIGAASDKSMSGSSPHEKLERVAKLDPHVKESISQGISDLAEMAPCHHFAEQALNILRYLAKKWNIDVEIADGDMPSGDIDKVVKPYTSSLNFFAPNVQPEDFICDWGSVGGQGGTPSSGGDLRQMTKEAAQESELHTAQKAGDSMDNPLFWPFPLQGRPMLPTGAQLEQAGFAIL